MNLFPWWNKYPYVNDEQLNLDWVLAQIKKLGEEVTNFINLNTIKYADPILWDITSQYEANTIVVDPQTGDAYISTTAVPRGVSLDNTSYWTKIYNYADAINTIQEQIAVANEGLATTASANRVVGSLVWLDGILYEVISSMNAGDAYVVGTNILQTTIETLIGNLSTLNTVDKDSLVDAINELLTTIGNLNTLESAIAAADIVTAINNSFLNLTTRVGNLNNLNTTDKNNLVNAINEVLTVIGDLDNLESAIAASDIVTTINNAFLNLTTRVGNLNNLNTSNKNNLVDAINEVLTYSQKRKYIFVGDSYDLDSSPSIRWSYYVVNYLGLTSDDYYDTAQGGIGFTSTGTTFLTLLQNLSVTDEDEITDIVVCGGFNENTTQAAIESAIASFVTYAKGRFKNARVHIGEMGWSPVWNYRNRIRNTTLPAFLNCTKYGAIPIPNLWLANHDYDNFIYNSGNYGIHPIDRTLLGQAVANHLMGVSTNIHGEKSLSLSSSYTATNVSIHESIENDMVRLSVTCQLSGTFTVSGNGTISVGKLSRGYASIANVNGQDCTVHGTLITSVGNVPCELYLSYDSGTGEGRELKIRILQGITNATYVTLQNFTILMPSLDC